MSGYSRFLILCALLLVGCNRGPAAEAGRSPEPQVTVEPQATMEPKPVPEARAAPEPRGPGLWTIDDENARIAREEVPGYAGRYRAGGRSVVLLADSASIDLARDYVARHPSRGLLPHEPRIVIVRYDAIQLLEWRNAGSRLMGSRTDIYSLDLDEVNNRISIGVRAGSEAEVEAAARGAGIPADALRVFTTEPVRLLIQEP